MIERIVSPEQLNGKMKVSELKVWIMLACLIIAVVGGLIWFLTRHIVITESHVCYVTSDVSRKDEALYRIFKKNLGDQFDFSVEDIWENYGSLVDGYVQIAYLIIENPDDSDIAERMTVRLEDKEGTIACLPLEKTDYAQMEKMGITDNEMRAAGLYPGLRYYLCTAFIDADNETDALKSGFYTATIELDHIIPVHFIFR